jgi:NAD(P)H-flavin reductase
MGEAPISIASAPCEDPYFELCVRRVGNVTAALHHLGVGAFVGIRGPFGRGFPDEQLKGQDVLVVAGGIGLVPVRPLIHHILCNRMDYGDFTILYGMKRPEEMLFRDEVTEWGSSNAVDLHLTIDRPHPDWAGHVGVVTTLFPSLELDAPRTRAVIVGPPIMYQFVILECRNKGIADEDIILSLERHMKCGVGKCGHCQINGKYVCQDGPVFNYHELKQLWEAI